MLEYIEYNNIKWYHLLNPQDDSLQFIQNKFGFHQLDIDDCRSKNQRPKVDTYDNYNFIILHLPQFDSTNKTLTTREIKFFWGKDYLISIGVTHWILIDLFEKMKTSDELQVEYMSGNSDKLFYLIIEYLLSNTFVILNKIGDRIELVNKELFGKKTIQLIEKISYTRRNIILLDTIFRPQLRLFQKLEEGTIKGFHKNMEAFWGNINDTYQKIWDIIEDYQDIISGLSKTFDSLQTNKMNEIMKTLTFISTVFLPLSVITGFYGMNVHLPFAHHYFVYWSIIGLMFVIILGFIFYFKRKKWM